MGIPVSCEVDIYGTLSEFIGTVVSKDTVTLLDINNTVPKDMYESEIKGKFDYTLKDTFTGYRDAHLGQTAVDIARNESELCLECRPAFSGQGYVFSGAFVCFDPV